MSFLNNLGLRKWIIRVIGPALFIMLIAYAWGGFYHSRIGSVSFTTIGDIISVFLWPVLSLGSLGTIPQQRVIPPLGYWLLRLLYITIFLQRFVAVTTDFGVTPKDFGRLWFDVIAVGAFFGLFFVFMSRAKQPTESREP